MLQGKAKGDIGHTCRDHKTREDQDRQVDRSVTARTGIRNAWGHRASIGRAVSRASRARGSIRAGRIGGIRRAIHGRSRVRAVTRR